MLLTTKPQAAASDPLEERYFTTAVHTLDDHRSDSRHHCVACGTNWPCAKVLAAAFVLDMHATDPVEA
ncbi:MAG: hypothetical protein JWL97_4153 [Gemmatimonadales bacterium]|jgi:hypothetical protein|nr:hypothetical protein [Gemmatimonadales bacterium]